MRGRASPSWPAVPNCPEDLGINLDCLRLLFLCILPGSGGLLFFCLPQASILSFSCHALKHYLSVFALPGSDSIEIDVGPVALPARIFFSVSISSLHWTSISIDRRFMATEGRRRQQ